MTPTSQSKNSNDRQVLGADSFAVGVMALLVANVLQRVLGLGRNLGFCAFLTDEDLGHWALVSGFFVIAVPVVVLGLPGSFGKFVEYFRQRGCLGQFLSRVTTTNLVVLSLCLVLMIAAPDWISKSLYGMETATSVMLWTAIALATLTAFNFVYELVIALRLIRVGSLMQFLNVAVFTLVGVWAIWYYASWHVLLPSYAVACLIATVPGLCCLRWQAWESMQTVNPMPMRQMWARILPFAATLWLANLLSNLFELSDRYMLLHLCRDGQEEAQRLVGQYYCGRIIPNLIANLAVLLSGMIMPYLSMDWEAKCHDAIRRRMENVIVSMVIVFTAGSALAIAGSPLLFQWGFGGRFSQGESILALSLVQTTWAGVSLVASMYLLCAEKGRQNNLLLIGGVIINLALNWPLIYYFDLMGSVVATTLANLLLMLATLWRVHKEGCWLPPRVWILCFVPMILLAGAECSLAGLLALTVLAGRTNWILSPEDRRWMDSLIVPKLQSWRIPIPSLWPAPKSVF